MIRTVRRYLITLVTFAASISAASATPITIVQTFGPLSTDVSVNGTMQTVMGDWIFTILTDTDAPNLEVSSTFGRFAATVTVSNSDLGLVDVGVTSHQFYYEANSNLAQSGIVSPTLLSTASLFGSVGSLGDPTVIEPGFLAYTSFANFLIFPIADPLILADGTIIATPFIVSGESATQSVEAVPEPVSMTLLGLGIAGVTTRLRRRRKAIRLPERRVRLSGTT